MNARPVLERAFGRWALNAYDHAGWTLVAVVLLTLLSLLATVRNLGVNADTADLLSPDLPFRKTVAQFQTAFPDLDDNILLVVQAPTPEQAEKAAEALSNRLAGEGSLFRSVYYPGNLPFFERNGLIYRDVESLRSLSNRLSEAQPLLALLLADASLTGLFRTVDEVLSRDNALPPELDRLIEELNATLEAGLQEQRRALSWRALITGDSKRDSYRQLVVARPVLDYGRVDAGAPAIEAIERAIDELGLTPEFGVEVGITGKVALVHDELQTVMQGAQFAGAIALLLVAIVLYAGLRSTRLVAITMLTLFVGLSLTAGFATVAIGHLNLISVAFAVLYVGLGVDYVIHFLLRYRELQAGANEPPEALRLTGRDMGPSLGLCAVSTAIGFYAFVPTAFVGVSELGIIAGTSMFISLVLSFTLLPALLRVFGGRLRATTRTSAKPPVKPSTSSWPHARAVVLVAFLFASLAVASLPYVRFDANPLNLRDPQSLSVSTLNRLLSDGETRTWSAVALAGSLDEARQVASRFDRLDVVDHAMWVLDLVPADQTEKLSLIEDLQLILGPEIVFAAPSATDHPPEQAIAAIASVRDRLAQSRTDAGSVPALRETLDALLAKLEAGSPAHRAQALEAVETALLENFSYAIEQIQQALRAEQFELADLPESLTRRWVSDNGLYLVEVSPGEDIREPDALHRFVTAVQSVVPDATGPPVLYSESARAISSAFRQALALAVGGICVVLALTLRRVRLVTAVLTPLVLGGSMTAAAMVVLGIPFNFANVIALPLVLGISVDNGVHMMHRNQIEGLGGADLLRTSTGKAVFLSTVTTLCSFGNLSFSPHPGTASMGQVLTIGIVLTLVSTVLVLPALLPSQSRSGSLAGQ